MKIADAVPTEEVYRHMTAFAEYLAFAGFCEADAAEIGDAWDGYDPGLSAPAQREALVAFGARFMAERQTQAA